MNKLLRRHLRHILSSKPSTANETLHLDAGWNKIENEILIRKAKLYREVSDGRRGTLASQVALITEARGTPWFKENERELGPDMIEALKQRFYFVLVKDYLISGTSDSELRVFKLTYDESKSLG